MMMLMNDTVNMFEALVGKSDEPYVLHAFTHILLNMLLNDALLNVKSLEAGPKVVNTDMAYVAGYATGDYGAVYNYPLYFVLKEQSAFWRQTTQICSAPLIFPNDLR